MPATMDATLTYKALFANLAACEDWGTIKSVQDELILIFHLQNHHLLNAHHLGMLNFSKQEKTLDIKINPQQFTHGITHGQPPQLVVSVIKELLCQKLSKEVFLLPMLMMLTLLLPLKLMVPPQHGLTTSLLRHQVLEKLERLLNS